MKQMKQILLAVVLFAVLVIPVMAQEVVPTPDPGCAYTEIIVRTQYGSYESYCGWTYQWKDGVLKLTSPENNKRFFSGHFEVWVYPKPKEN